MTEINEKIYGIAVTFLVIVVATFTLFFRTNILSNVFGQKGTNDFSVEITQNLNELINLSGEIQTESNKLSLELSKQETVFTCPSKNFDNFVLSDKLTQGEKERLQKAIDDTTQKLTSLNFHCNDKGINTNEINASLKNYYSSQIELLSEISIVLFEHKPKLDAEDPVQKNADSLQEYVAGAKKLTVQITAEGKADNTLLNELLKYENTTPQTLSPEQLSTYNVLTSNINSYNVIINRLVDADGNPQDSDTLLADVNFKQSVILAYQDVASSYNYYIVSLTGK